MKGFWGCVFVFLAAPAFAEVPLADFARNDSYSEASISPDGAYLALKIPIGRQFGLAVFDIAKQQIISKINVGADRSVDQYWWANSKRLVVSLAEDSSLGERPVIYGDLIGVDADGRSSEYLFGFRGETVSLGSRLGRETAHRGSATVIRTLPNDPAHILISVKDYSADKDFGTETAYRMDVQSGRLDQNLAAPISGGVKFIADSNGFIRYAVGEDEHSIIRTFVRTPEKPQWAPLASGELKNVTATPLGLSNDNQFAYLSSDEGGDRRCLVRQNLASGERTSLSCDAVSSLDSVVMSFDGDEPVAAIYEAGRPEVHFLDTKNSARRILAELQKAFPGEIAHPVSHTQDGRLAVVETYSDHNPGDYYLFDTRTLKAQYLVGKTAWIDPDQMAEVRPISYPARDGKLIYGYLTLPQGREAKNLPLVVNPHGGPFRIRDNWEWHAEAQALASRGYAVLQVNFRGSSGFGNSFVGAGRQGWDSVMIDDITDGARWAVASGVADAKRLCIYGASYGGYAALMSVAREPDLYRCAIGYAGIYNLETLKRDTDFTTRRSGRTYFDEFIGTDPKRLRAASPINYVDQLKAAVMIVHGTEDQRAPYSQATELRKALDAHKYPYEWLVKEGEGHGFYKPENRTEFLLRLIAFLDKNLAPSASRAQAANPAN